MTSESCIQSEVRLAASEAGLTLWRNNVGVGWVGKAVHLPDGSVLIKNPRPLHAGLCKGSSDLIGYRPLTIGPEHVGMTIAQFAAVEVKTAKGRRSVDQRRFLDHVTDSGGFAIVTRSPGDLT
jgi:hypothetical protein